MVALISWICSGDDSCLFFSGRNVDFLIITGISLLINTPFLMSDGVNVMKGALFLLIVIVIDEIASNDEWISMEGCANNGKATFTGVLSFKMSEEEMDER